MTQIKTHYDRLLQIAYSSINIYTFSNLVVSTFTCAIFDGYWAVLIFELLFVPCLFYMMALFAFGCWEEYKKVSREWWSTQQRIANETLSELIDRLISEEVEIWDRERRLENWDRERLAAHWNTEPSPVTKVNWQREGF